MFFMTGREEDDLEMTPADCGETEAETVTSM